ncbi:MAG: alpha/beta hydrolase [Candidatus Latescibacteria bacterium]|nr:alpha/beta hydrolase [Candidatus Latescibacterota bacterium]
MRTGIILLLSWVFCLPGLSTAQATNIVEKDIEVYGFNMHYAEAGQGPPVIVLHGLWGGRNEWDRNIEALAADFRMIVVDQIGFHGSDKPDISYHNALLGQFLAGFIEAMDIPRAILMGQAMGANTATYMAVHYPHLVERLILVDGAGYRNPSRDLAKPPSEQQLRFYRVATGTTLSATQNFLKRRVFNKTLVTESWAEEAFAMWLRSARAIQGMLRDGGDVTEEEMQTISVPTLIIWGQEDAVFPIRNADRLSQDIKGAIKVVFPKTGHLSQLEKPEAFNKIVRDFLIDL